MGQPTEQQRIVGRSDEENPRRLATQAHHPGELLAAHGSAKQAEPTDPLNLVAAMAQGGDLDELARCFIEEYAAMGYQAEQILSLFREPQYLAIHPVYRLRGEEAMRRMIGEVLADCGVFRCTETVSEPASRCPKLVQIELPCGSRKEDEQP